MRREKPCGYRTNEFAAMAGVTVRALHHYDRLGLLRPARHPENGYRLYGESDLGRLEQILVLKFLGLPLEKIRDVLERESTLASALRRQQRVLVEKRGRLDRAIHAIAAALRATESTGRPEWESIKVIIKEVEMLQQDDWTTKYYSKEAEAKIEARKHQWTPELQEQVSQQWSELFRDVETMLGDDPASPKAQALITRWKKLVEGFTGGDQEVQSGLNAMYADQGNWPPQQHQAFGIRPEILDFVRSAMKASGDRK